MYTRVPSLIVLKAESWAASGDASGFKYESSFLCFAKKKTTRNLPPSNHDTPPPRASAMPSPAVLLALALLARAAGAAPPCPSHCLAIAVDDARLLRLPECVECPPAKPPARGDACAPWCALVADASVRRLIPECKACDAAAAAADAAIDDPAAAAARAPRRAAVRDEKPFAKLKRWVSHNLFVPHLFPRRGAAPDADVCPEWCHWLPEHKKWIPKCRGCLHA